MRKQFIVKESNKKNREEFYDYITCKYKLDVEYPYTKDEFIESSFPFVVDFEENNFWICDSVTCCACAASQHVMFSIDDFKKMIRK